ncbi:hypothetical protein R5R51_04375 [Oenococcus oeni]|uniref:Uncharacterized protein n=1 Tax=Oenococcus oeni AWRIB429 TaxID=655225 RepID=D3LC75_OENOE|nr:hypothetical protein [Oenococcus oeni]EFD87522.1 hypothetical protein AWRIB429_1955 [Oenococcus oeni AWRIB429]MDQ8719331.1 hypothetical protein [Oenococcus oeni]UCU86347.1 hypothetical protein J3U91_00469 [Oenococcus oeni]
MNKLEQENSALHFENARLKTKLHIHFWSGLFIGWLLSFVFGWLLS